MQAVKDSATNSIRMEIPLKGIMGQPMREYKRAKNIGPPHRERPLLGVKRTLPETVGMSAYDGGFNWSLQHRS
jgi:hypothetical protein